MTRLIASYFCSQLKNTKIAFLGQNFILKLKAIPFYRIGAFNIQIHSELETHLEIT